MIKYNLTSEEPDDDWKKDMEESFRRSAHKIDQAEALLKGLGLSEFELKILARRLLDGSD